MKNIKKAFLALCAFGLAACDMAPQKTVVLRRVELKGDSAKFAGSRLVHDLRAQGVKVTESAETARVLTGTSTLKDLEGGAKLFTLEITDGQGLLIRQTISTQDLKPLDRNKIVLWGVDRVAEALIQQLTKKVHNHDRGGESVPLEKLENKKAESYRSS